MKITQLDIEGFRSLKNVSWKPGDLNVIIGPNGSGKSNLLRLLEMMSAAAQGRLRRYIQEAGGMGALVWDGQSDALVCNTALSGLEVGFSDYLYRLVLSPLGQPASVYFIQEEVMRVGPDLTTNEDTTIAQIVRHHQEVWIYGQTWPFSGEQGKLTLDPATVPIAETLLSLTVGPFVSNPRPVALQRQFAQWAVYQDLRTDQAAALRQAVVARHETHVSVDGQNLINVLHTLYTGDREFKKAVNQAMRAAFGEDFDELIFPPAADQRVQLRVRWKTLSREQSAADLSDGTLRFLFLLAVLANPSPPSLIAIDEPETGLHPSMLPLVAELATDAATRAQIILTTHSDQLLDAFGETRPTTTVAKWADGETTLTTLDGDELAYWLKDYSLGRLFRTGELEALA